MKFRTFAFNYIRVYIELNFGCLILFWWKNLLLSGLKGYFYYLCTLARGAIKDSLGGRNLNATLYSFDSQILAKICFCNITEIYEDCGLKYKW